MSTGHYYKTHKVESINIGAELVDKYSINPINSVTNPPINPTLSLINAVNFLQSLSKTRQVKWRYGIIELYSDLTPTERVSVFTNNALLMGQFYEISRNDKVEEPKYKFTPSENWKIDIVEDYYLETVESRYKNGKPKFRRAMTDNPKQYKIIDIFKILLELNKSYFDEETLSKAYNFVDTAKFDYSLFGSGLYEYLKNSNNIDNAYDVSINKIIKSQTLDDDAKAVYFEYQYSKYPKFGDDEKDVRRVDDEEDFDFS